MSSAIVRAGLVLTTANVVGQASSLFRNLLLAYFLGAAEMGLAAALILVVSFQNVLTDLAVNQLVVQSPSSDESSFRETLQLIELVRGGLSAILVYLTAPIVAALFRMPDIESSIQLVAFVPLLGGMKNLGVQYATRTHNYVPAALVIAIPQLVALVSIFPLFQMFPDHRAAAYAYLLQAIVAAIVAYASSPISFRMSFHQDHLPEILSFGVPLLANGVLLALCLQGDRIIVASSLSSEDLGIYSMAALVAINTSSLIKSVLDRFYLAELSRRFTKGGITQADARQTNEVYCAVGGAMLLGFVIFSQTVSSVLFTSDYEAIEPVLLLLGAAQAIRSMRAAPTICAVASAETKTVAWSNLLRLALLLVTAYVALLTSSLVWISFSCVIAEVLVLIYVDCRISKKLSFSRPMMVGPLIMVAFYSLGALFLLRSLSLQDNFLIFFQGILFTFVLSLIVLSLPTARKVFK